MGQSLFDKTQLRGCLIAVPSSGEKERIVAKADKLMALCYQLKVRLETAQQPQNYLADALVERALA